MKKMCLFAVAPFIFTGCATVYQPVVPTGGDTPRSVCKPTW